MSYPVRKPLDGWECRSPVLSLYYPHLIDISRGFGNQMSNSPMIIMWSNSDGTITVSQREASGHSTPQVVSNPDRVATLAESASTVSAAAQMPLCLPLITLYSSRRRDQKPDSRLPLMCGIFLNRCQIRLSIFFLF